MLPDLHPVGIPDGHPYPVLICLPDGTPILAVADLAPDYDAVAVARFVCDRVNGPPEPAPFHPPMELGGES